MMTIIYSKKITPLTIARIKKSDAFIALITNNFIKEDRGEECKIAEQLNKPMYAIVEEGTTWDKYKELPWRKILYFKKEANHSGIEAVVKEIEKDLKWYRSIGGA